MRNRQPIRQWQDIADRYTSGLIVGNGASIAVAPTFSYASLYEAAQDLGHIDHQVSDVFNRFNTRDFELVLRRLWHATLVNTALEIPAGRVEEAYTAVRDALIRTVRDTHVSYERALPHLKPIYQFMKRFETVISLNYDLIVYWAAMLGNDEHGNWFKDGFQNGRLDENWHRFRGAYGAAGTTMFFYAHGNVVLARNRNGLETKITAPEGQDLLDTILDRWSTGALIPLFVCEGTSDHKRLIIGSSPYLNTVHHGPMGALGESVVIYGWGIGDQDEHILEALQSNPPQRVAVSVRGADHEYVDRAYRRLITFADEVEFFACDSPGCWNVLLPE